MTEIQLFWHGIPLSLLENLTLKSFINRSYKVNLWSYDKNLKLEVPGVAVCDANDVIPYDELYTYTGNGDCRKGSIGGFSDLFRYVLLYKFGGVYVDMDSVCLSYFDFNEYEYIIKPHKHCGTVANVLKAPKGSEFLNHCIRQTKQTVNRDNNNWVLPVEIFNNAVQIFNLQKFIVSKDFFGCDDNVVLRKLKNESYVSAIDFLPRYILHWCREASYGNWAPVDSYNWKKPKPLSTYSCLLAENGLL